MFGRFTQPLTILLAALLLLVGAGACSRGDESEGSDDGLQVTLEVTPQPPAIGPAQLVITIEDDAGEPVSGASLELEGNMSHAGMQPVFVEASEDGPGRYVSEGFEFTMGGDWIITISGTLVDGSELRRTFDVREVAS